MIRLQHLKYLGYFFFFPFWCLQRLLPRSRHIWVFGAWYGDRYSDNSRYLYEYVLNNHPEITVIWLTRSKVIQEKVNQSGGRAYLINSLMGIYFSLRAANIIVSSGKNDINALFINGANWIQLWHGNPMKKIGKDDTLFSYNGQIKQLILSFAFPFAYEFNYHYVVSNANVFSNKMASAFDVPIQSVWEVGCPRNDAFYIKKTSDFMNTLKLNFPNCKVLFYLPTFRSHNKISTLFNIPDFDESQIETFLKCENLVLVTKGHYVDNQLTTQVGSKDSRLVHLTDEATDDINFLLKDADLLITDYSGAYFDFLLTERPILFAAFDLKDYLNFHRELYFNYFDIVAGPIVVNWSELMQSLKTIFEDQDYKELIHQKNCLFNKYHDARNSQRVCEAILSLNR